MDVTDKQDIQEIPGRWRANIVGRTRAQAEKEQAKVGESGGDGDSRTGCKARPGRRSAPRSVKTEPDADAVVKWLPENKALYRFAVADRGNSDWRDEACDGMGIDWDLLALAYNYKRLHSMMRA